MSLHWAGMKDDQRLREVRGMVKTMSVREIAAELHTSKGIISGFIYRRIQHPTTSPRPPAIIWTAEMDSRLRIEVSNGRTAEEIGKLLGVGSARAVHARLKRIQLRMREVQSAMHRAAQHVTTVRKSKKWKEPPTLAVVPVANPKPFIDRRMGFECAWIVGDPREPEPHCCGAATEFGATWCKPHRQIVYGRAA
jgi:hypothetical protein